MTPGILAPFRPQIELYKTIAEATGAVRQRYAWWPCGKGCSACCRHAYPIAESEWLFMRLGLARLPAARQESIRQRARAVVARMRAEVGPTIDWGASATARRLGVEVDLPCPFLDEDGACDAYDVRPAICRMFGYGAYIDGATGQPVPAYCTIVEGELQRRQTAGQEVELADMTDQRAALNRIALGPRRSIAEWAAED
jgi:Fe-S-cluster containining protein